MSGGQPPKKQSTQRRTALRQNNIRLALKRVVNGKLSNVGAKVKVYTTKRESGKKV